MENQNIKKENLFSALRRLFSTDVVIRNDGKDTLKVIDTDAIQQNGVLQNNSLVDRFNKIYTTSTTYGVNLNLAQNYQSARVQIYADYDAMDTDAIIAAALDVIADESCLRNDFNQVLRINSSDETIQKHLENLFYSVMNIEFNLWSWVRNMCKYGDTYLKLEISEKYGVYNVIPFSAFNIIREEGYDEKNPSSVRFRFDPTAAMGASTGYSSLNTKDDGVFFDNYEMAHFRLIGDVNYLPYGRSYLEPARKLFKQYALIEDAMLIHRITRAPERRTFYVNVGAIPPTEVENYIQRMISKMKKTPLMDPQTGQYNLKYNQQNLLEDFFIPIRGNDQSTRIETAKGLEYNAIEDVQYFRDKLFAALKIPKAYLGYEKDLCIVPETKIPLLNGETKTVAEIIDDYNNGIQHYTFSINEANKEVVPGKILWAGYTRKNAELVRVWLDNNSYIDCTPDHNFMTRDGQWIEAKDLNEGQALMPYYVKDSVGQKAGYSMIYNPATEKYVEVHRMVPEYYGKIYKGSGKVVHHIDFNKKNNYPENLDISTTFLEHRKYHQQHISKTLNSKENIKIDFIYNQIPKAVNNIGFINNYKSQAEYKNHKVVKVEKLDYTKDTCDLHIEDHHNFATAAGVFIHNSGKATLAAEDIRFARTIERIQQIILSELKKIALVHLYACGYTDSSAANFELSLTGPSIIYDQERVAIFKEKLDVARSAVEDNIFPMEYIWENIFRVSPDSFGELDDMIAEDQKRKFRYKQISEEGNDPVESGKAYGTPHQIASLYGGNKVLNVPDGYNENLPDQEVGRPTEKVSSYGKDNSSFGRDPLGNKENSGSKKSNNSPGFNFKDNSPLALENTMTAYLKNESGIKNLFNKMRSKKNQLLTEDDTKGTILDETNIIN